MSTNAESEFRDWLVTECGYISVHPLGDGRYTCLSARAFNTQILVGRIGDRTGYDDAW